MIRDHRSRRYDSNREPGAPVSALVALVGVVVGAGMGLLGNLLLLKQQARTAREVWVRDRRVDA